mmetsp:Transcript_15463/g.55636  ORF Transcript_15463/g.55636 Transcript_15463/m.55636 type:complete len:89 (+) Transcript_15463:281-547(+)
MVKNLHNHSTVNIENLTSYVCSGRIQCQKLNKASNIFWLTITSKWDSLKNLCLNCASELSSHIGSDEAGSNSIAVNIASSILACNSFS